MFRDFCARLFHTVVLLVLAFFVIADSSAAPVFSGVAPADNAYIKNVTTSSAITYTLSGGDLSAGTVYLTRVAGTADGTMHTCQLTGTALTAGTHTLDLSDTTNSCTSNVSDLVSGAIYDIAITGTDTSNNAVPQVAISNVTFDNTAPLFSNVAPAENAVIGTVTNASALQYTLDEDLSDGTLGVTLISGTDANAPHTCVLKGNALKAGAHILDLSDTTNGCTSDVSNLVSGAVYGMVITGRDAAGNDAKWTYNGIPLTGVAVGPITFDTSTDASLSGLTLSAGILSPVFDGATTAYTASVGNAMTAITVTPTVHNAAATVAVNGNAVTSGNASGSINLNVGANTVAIVGTAQDGSTIKTYTLTVTRSQSSDATLSGLTLSQGSLAPAFASATTAYAATLSNGVASVTLTPTVTDANATVTVNGATVASGQASGALDLNVGSNTLTTQVTAQDGTTKTYTATLTRLAASNVTAASGNIWGAVLQITTSSALNTAVTPAASAFSVKVNGQARNVNAVTHPSANIVQLALSSAVVAGDVVTVSYAAPASDALQDTSGNSLAGFTNLAINNFTYFPLCSSDASVSCIDSLAVVGGTDSGNLAQITPTVWIINNLVQNGVNQGNVISAQLWKNGLSTDDLTDPSLGFDPTTRFQLVLKLRNYSPRAMVGWGKNVTWSIGTPTNGVTTVTIVGSPVAMSQFNTLPADVVSNWPTGNADKADVTKGAVQKFYISDLSSYSQDEQTALAGTVLATDAQVFTLPVSIAPVGGAVPALDTFIGAPHFRPDGSLNTGFFEVHFPATLLKYWGDKTVNSLTAKYLDSTDFTAIAENGGGARIDLNLHYSSGNVRISVQTAAAAPSTSYGPGPVAPPITSITIDSSKPVDIPAGGNAILGAAATLVAGAGSTITIRTGSAVDGASIVLPTPDEAAGGHTASAITVSVGGQSLTVTPLAAGTALTVKMVSVDGVSTPVLEVSSGTVTISASQPGQALLSVGGGQGSNAIVITAETAGTSASSTVSATTGETIVAVSSGVVTLPTDAFAATNAFAAIKGGKLYAGEVAVLNQAGKIANVFLGSSDGKGALPGDQLDLGAINNLNLRVSSAPPRLEGISIRIGGTRKLDAVAADVLSQATGVAFVSKGQNNLGMVRFESHNAVVNALPVGKVMVDTSRADGIVLVGNGRVEVAKDGVITAFMPAVADFAEFAGHVVSLDKGAVITIQDDGAMSVTFNGVVYPLQAAWMVSKGEAGRGGIALDERGQVVYRDNAGNWQTLYPVFADLGGLAAAFRPLDPAVKVTGNDDGTATAQLLGKKYCLVPDAALVAVPEAHAKDAWWKGDDGKLYIKNSGGKTAQGFSVR